MSLRPVPARWFELLTARDDLAIALEHLARRGTVELESRADTATTLELPDLHTPLEEYNRLTRRYHNYWPAPRVLPHRPPSRPEATLSRALDALYGWRAEADPVIQRLEALRAEEADLVLLTEWLQALGESALDCRLLPGAGPALTSRAFVLPIDARALQLPPSVLHLPLVTVERRFLLAVGSPGDLDALEQQVQAHKGRRIWLPPWLGPRSKENLALVERRLHDIAEQKKQTGAQLETLCERFAVAEALGEIARLEWFMIHAARLPASENFAWVTGWTSESQPEALNAVLEAAEIRGIVRFPVPPGNLSPPMVVRNPWWAKPFELFLRALGTPGKDEVDPSRLLALIVPLLFGYMFGDMGQGAVLLIGGIALSPRWPALRLLIAGGLSSILFGWMFGSVFCREDLVAPLWLRPIESPLPVLIVPLFGGVVLLLLGLLLSGAEASWGGRLTAWLRTELGVVILYLGLVAAVFHPGAVWLMGAGLTWYLLGTLSLRRTWRSLPGAVAELLESALQLAINTLSFSRVGAFALAHAGLALAVVSLAEDVGSPVLALLALIVGNALIIALEGLVVSIQTTRLVLFEFFIRFLRAEGRVFRPLERPPV